MSKRILSAFFVWMAVLGVVAVQPVSAAPVAPTGVTAALGAAAGQIDVTWVPPVITPGDPALTGYTITLSPGSVTAAAGPGATATSLGGVAPGTYTAVVTAEYALPGTPQASAPSGSVTVPAPATVPGAPTAVSASLASPSSATVSFTAPANNGGSAITGYTVTSSPGGLTASGGASPLTVTGLSPATAYTFTVTATNGVGTGPASGPSASVTTPPVIVPPSAPTSVVATATGQTTATVTFSPPANNGGDPAITYVVTASPGSASVSGGSPASFTGLSPSTTYTFTVTASNGAGAGGSDSDTATTLAVPPPAPTAPRNVDASATSPTAVEVSFDPPANASAASVVDYTVTASPGGASVTVGSSPATMSGLLPDTPYNFTVVANGPSLSGPGASDSATTPPVPVPPSAPRNVNASAVSWDEVRVTFSAPANPGTSPVTSYVVSWAGGSETVTGSPVVIDGLNGDTDYVFTVVARSSAGTGPGASDAVTTPPEPTAPGAPTIGRATLVPDSSADVTFSPPSDNGGSSIIRYTVTASPGGRSASGTGSPIRVNGLDSNTNFTFTVTATNGVGTSSPSGRSNSIKTPGRPNAPTDVAAVLAGNTSATVSFDAPDDNDATISGYTVVSEPGGIEATGDSSPIEITGLQPGETYTFRVTATNSVGTGGRSAASNDLFIPVVPGLALITEVVSAAPYTSTVTVTWEPPTETGGSPVTQYVVEIAGIEQSIGPDGRSITFEGVPVGVHTPTLVAITVAGRGPVATGPEVEVRAFAPFSSEESFIAQIYQDILGREADQAGLEYWTELTADDGSNVADIIRSFMFSSEFDSRRAIARLYLAFFDRRPDIAGFDYWAQQINSGQANLDTISESFVTSREFQETYGSLSDQNFIRLVYNNVLVREPDQAGYDFWLVQLNAGMTRGELMTRFSESPEFVAGTRPAVDVIVTYRSMLNRQPDDAGFIFWLGQIAGDPDAITSLIGGFYSSQEYADRISP